MHWATAGARLLNGSAETVAHQNEPLASSLGSLLSSRESSFKQQTATSTVPATAGNHLPSLLLAVATNQLRINYQANHDNHQPQSGSSQAAQPVASPYLRLQAAAGDFAAIGQQTAASYQFHDETAATTTMNYNQQQQQVQSESWWSDYWSRQPFPSGYTQSSITFLACLMSAIIILIVVGNLLVCIAIFTEKSLKPTQNWFIASLAVSDMLLGAVVMPFSLARELMGFWVFGSLWCDIHEAADVLLTTASINTLCLISLDRYWSITKAVLYLKFRTPRRGALMIAFVWILSAAISLPPLFGWKKPGAISSTSSATNTTERLTPPSPVDTPSGEEADSDEERRERRFVLATELATPILPAQRAPLGSAADYKWLASAGDSYGTPSASSSVDVDAHEDYSTATSGLATTGTHSHASQHNPFLSTPLAAQPANGQPGLNQAAASAASQTEFPQCGLSDHLGYVLYSAFFSFYAPCAIMIFTYVKIFHAARSRARRAINKQSARQTGVQASLDNKPLRSDQANSLIGPAKKSPAIAANATANNQFLDSSGGHQSSPPKQQQLDGPPMKGKIVIVERKKSMTASSLAPLTNSQKPSSNLAGGPHQTDPTLVSCTLTAGEAKQASSADIAFNEAISQQEEFNTQEQTDISRDSSLITVMSSNMAALPVTRFNFKQISTSEESPEEINQEASKTAAFLETIGQVNADGAADRLLADDSPTGQPNIVVHSQSLSPVDSDRSPVRGQTKETCFMTIEEDSDMFDAQTGRTIMMIAGNTGNARQMSNSSKGMTMTMLPAGGQQQQQQQQQVVCGNALCRRRARSGSSYCGSSVTINEDDMDDDELLTDDCNGYSASCTLDQYCTSRGSICAHCQECDCEATRTRSSEGGHVPELPDSPSSVGGSRHQTELTGRHRIRGCHAHDLQAEVQSSTGDDNISLTEYRSNEDSSSIMGHDMLDATDAVRSRKDPKRGKKKRTSGELERPPVHNNIDRKRSIIGFRLNRLSSTASPGNQASGLLALVANSQQQEQQQQQNQHQSALTGVRNLKALRQNFFLRLNQLTAKSSFRDQSSNATKQSAQYNCKSSSGTSYEQSADGATTSQAHSTEFQPETIAISMDGPETRPTSSGVESNDRDGSRRYMSARQATQQVLGVEADNNNCYKSSESESHRAEVQKEQPGAEQISVSVITSSSNELNNKLQIPSQEGRNLDKSPGHLQPQVQQKTRKTATSSNQNNRGLTIKGSGGQAGQAGSGRTLQQTSDYERHKRKLAKARERRATLILGLIMAAFVCSWLPFFTFYVSRAICKVCATYVHPRFEAFIFWMGYCNSAINPIIYTIFNRDFRKAFKKILFKCL